jgi:hypothetical protein
MQAAHCPSCRGEFSIDPAFDGHTVSCVFCRKTFVFVAEPHDRSDPSARPRRRAYHDQRSGGGAGKWLAVAAGVAACALVSIAAAVYLYERVSFRADRARLESARWQLANAIGDRQARELEIDSRSPRRPDPLELDFQRRARYEKDTIWRGHDRRVMELEYEVKVILDRWPELRR